jgi:hypothetical protein
MKVYNYILLFMLSGLILSCSTVKVTTDQDKTTDFSQFKTYSFLGWQEDSDKILSDFDKKRLHDAFKEELVKRNLNYVEKGGDMAISLFIVVSKETSTTAYTNYYGSSFGGRYGRYNRYGYGWGSGYATTTFSENDYLKGTLVMDVFDEQSGDQIWQAIGIGTIQEDPEKREKSIPKTIAALMKKFPITPLE